MSLERQQKSEDYSIAILKPDAFRDYLSQMIIDDFEEYGLDVVFRKQMLLDEETAQDVYLEHKDSELYPFMVESLLLERESGEQLPCMLLILKRRQGEGSALDQTQVAKGRADKSGIRAKYRLYFWYELEEMGFEGRELSLKLSQNRLHVPDDYERLSEVLGVLLSKADLERLRDTALDFADWLEERFEQLDRHKALVSVCKD